MFTEETKGIKLTSYEIPEGYDKKSFNYENMNLIDYSDLKISEKFTPAFYVFKENFWEGGSVSNFSPIMKFTLLMMNLQHTIENKVSMSTVT